MMHASASARIIRKQEKNDQKTQKKREFEAQNEKTARF